MSEDNNEPTSSNAVQMHYEPTILLKDVQPKYFEPTHSSVHNAWEKPVAEVPGIPKPRCGVDELPEWDPTPSPAVGAWADKVVSMEYVTPLKYKNVSARVYEEPKPKVEFVNEALSIPHCAKYEHVASRLHNQTKAVVQGQWNREEEEAKRLTSMHAPFTREPSPPKLRALDAPNERYKHVTSKLFSPTQSNLHGQWRNKSANTNGDNSTAHGTTDGSNLSNGEPNASDAPVWDKRAASSTSGILDKQITELPGKRTHNSRYAHIGSRLHRHYGKAVSARQAEPLPVSPQTVQVVRTVAPIPAQVYQAPPKVMSISELMSMHGGPEAEPSSVSEEYQVASVSDSTPAVDFQFGDSDMELMKAEDEDVILSRSTSRNNSVSGVSQTRSLDNSLDWQSFDDASSRSGQYDEGHSGRKEVQNVSPSDKRMSKVHALGGGSAVLNKRSHQSMGRALPAAPASVSMAVDKVQSRLLQPTTNNINSRRRKSVVVEAEAKAKAAVNSMVKQNEMAILRQEAMTGKSSIAHNGFSESFGTTTRSPTVHVEASHKPTLATANTSQAKSYKHVTSKLNETTEATILKTRKKSIAVVDANALTGFGWSGNSSITPKKPVTGKKRVPYTSPITPVSPTQVVQANAVHGTVSSTHAPSRVTKASSQHLSTKQSSARPSVSSSSRQQCASQNSVTVGDAAALKKDVVVPNSVPSSTPKVFNMSDFFASMPAVQEGEGEKLDDHNEEVATSTPLSDVDNVDEVSKENVNSTENGIQDMDSKCGEADTYTAGTEDAIIFSPSGIPLMDGAAEDKTEQFSPPGSAYSTISKDGPDLLLVRLDQTEVDDTNTPNVLAPMSFNSQDDYNGSYNDTLPSAQFTEEEEDFMVSYENDGSPSRLVEGPLAFDGDGYEGGEVQHTISTMGPSKDTSVIMEASQDTGQASSQPSAEPSDPPSEQSISEPSGELSSVIMEPSNARSATTSPATTARVEELMENGFNCMKKLGSETKFVMRYVWVEKDSGNVWFYWDKGCSKPKYGNKSKCICINANVSKAVKTGKWTSSFASCSLELTRTAAVTGNNRHLSGSKDKTIDLQLKGGTAERDCNLLIETVNAAIG